jgi:ADP-ribose pyrophosphatase YjhB (NUDIX family)
MVSKISELSEREFLENYDVNKYEHPSVTVDTLIFSVMDNDTSNYRKLPEKELKILLIRRKDHPYINQWALPGGFVEMDEDLDDAAYRELREETSVKDVYLEQLYTWGDVNRDPRTRVISCSYMALINGKNTVIRASSDARDVQWFSLRSKVIQENKTI